MTRPTAEVQSWLADREVLSIVPLADSLVEALGHEPRSAYVETYWLGVIGPSALWAMRRLSAWVEIAPEGTVVGLADLAGELGLGSGTGRNSPLIRTLARLVMFGLAEIEERHSALAVRRAIPPLAARHLCRLPDHLAARCLAEPVRRNSSAAATHPAVASRCG